MDLLGQEILDGEGELELFYCTINLVVMMMGRIRRSLL